MGWTGRALAPNGFRCGLTSTHIAMSQRTDAVIANTIGIDMGKNTLHLIDLDDQALFCAKSLRATGLDPARQYAAMFYWH
jgi:hypothetical protein